MGLEITDDFVVPLSLGDTWALLTDVEKIAPCLPGARLDEVTDGEYAGAVRVKVGPITVEYKGTASFSELDEVNHRLVLVAAGRETRGQGNAAATVTASLIEEGGATKVDLRTDLDITGKVAQFGRGVLSDVSGRLLRQFVANLERDLIAAGSAPTVEGAPGSSPEHNGVAAGPETDGADSGDRTVTRPVGTVTPAEPEPLNLVRLVGGTVGRKLLPGFVLLVIAAVARRFRNKTSADARSKRSGVA
jgi:carbon monoxide dehydrogenase subunit G